MNEVKDIRTEVVSRTFLMQMAVDQAGKSVDHKGYLDTNQGLIICCETRNTL